MSLCWWAFAAFLVQIFGYPAPAFSNGPKQKSRKSGKVMVVAHRPKHKAVKIAGAPLQWADAAEFQYFVEKIKAVQNGHQDQIRALIIGDSHMQCEDFGSALRQYFVDSLALPLAGKGFVFPYPLARTSHRSDNQFGPNQNWHGCRFTKESNACEWGLAGWTAHFPGDSTRFRWSNGGTVFQQGDTILLFCPLKSSVAYKVGISVTTDSVIPMSYDEKRLGFLGLIPDVSKEIRFHLQKLGTDTTEFVLQGILHAPRGPGLVLGISGTNGARLDHYLLNPEFSRHMRIVNPDLLVISLGTNEAFSPGFQPEEVKQYLANLLTRVKAAVPHAAILLMGPPDHRMVRKANPRVSAISQIYAQTAEELDLVFWDQQKAMGGPGAIFTWHKMGLATKDMVHFTPQGYRLQARLLGAAIKKIISPTTVSNP